MELCCPDGGKEVLINKVFGLLALQKHWVIKMRENLLLFNNELDKLKETGWDYEIIYQNERKRIYVVKAEVPEKVWRHLHNQK